MGDPFSSVGDVYSPKAVKLREVEDREGIDKLREVRGFERQYNPEIGVDEEQSPQDRGIISIDDGIEREVQDTDVQQPANKNDTVLYKLQ